MDSLTARHLDHAMRDGGSGNTAVVAELETSFADLVGAEFALCTSSGTAALVCALWAAGVRAGDAVAVSALGPAMTGLAITAIGARPVFLDVADPSSFGISEDAALACASERLKAVVLVPMWGYWDENPQVLSLFRDRGIPIIVDAAQAPFLQLRRSLSTVVDIVCLSLHGRKPFKAGEGGVCLTNSESMARAIVQMRNFGQMAVRQDRRIVAEGSFASARGSNFKMNGLGAAWCLAQVQNAEAVRDRLERARRSAVAALMSTQVPWTEACQSPDVIEHGRYGVVAVCANPAQAQQLATGLEARGVAVDTRLYRYAPMYEAPYLAQYATPCPVASELTTRVTACRLEQFALPIDVQDTASMASSHETD